MNDAVLGVDFGTSNTAAVLHRHGRVEPLLFDGSPLLPSAIYLDPAAGLLVGKDAERAAGAAPARFEPNPKRRIDDGTIWLDEREITVVDAIGAVLHRAAAEAVRVAGSAADQTVLTHPAGWGGQRMQVLNAAAARAQLPNVRFVPEPVAAASYFTTVLGRHLPVGRSVVVYDFGGGTFDVAVVLRTDDGFDVLAADGLPNVGGLDLDAAIVAHVREGTADASEAWGRLDWPQSAADRRARRLLWEDVRAAKEQLSRHPTATLHVPLAETDRHVTREEFEKLAHRILNQTVLITIATLRAARIGRETVSDIFLVGGSSRVPLAASMLHRALGIAPTVIEQPELVVAAGAPHAVRPAIGTAPAPRATASAPMPPPPSTPAPPAVTTPPPAPAATAPPAPAPQSPAPQSPPAPPAPAPETASWPPVGPLIPPAGQPQTLPHPAQPRPPRTSSGILGAPLLRAAGWLALVGGAVLGLIQLAVVFAELDSYDFGDWILEFLTPLLISAINVAVGVVAWRLTRMAGERAWNAAGLLIGYALLALSLLLFVIPDLGDVFDGAPGFRELVIYSDILFVVVGAMAAAALRGMSKPPSRRRRPHWMWFAGLVGGAVVSAILYLTAFASSWSAFSDRQGAWLISTAVLAVALPVYGVIGRPAALAVGMLAAWFTAALPLAGVLTDWENNSTRTTTSLALFLAANLVVAFAARRCLKTEKAAAAS